MFCIAVSFLVLKSSRDWSLYFNSILELCSYCRLTASALCGPCVGLWSVIVAFPGHNLLKTLHAYLNYFNNCFII